MADPALEAALEIKLKGNVLFKENNFEEAIKLYSQAIDACPKHRYCWLTVPCNKIASCQCCVYSLLTFLNACRSFTQYHILPQLHYLRQAELAVMYQNRAASHERMERWAEATSDCDLSIKNNNK